MNDSENAGSVVLLGVQGSGKTVFLSILDECFAEPAAFGLSLFGMAGTPTSDYVHGAVRRMRDDNEWPASTGERDFFELSWVVRSGTRPLFTLESIDCAGESIVKALAPAFKAESGERASDRQKPGADEWDNEDDGAARADADDMSERIRERVAAAKVVCLFVNPNDFSRHINDGGDDIGDEEYVKAARERCDAMSRLLRVFLEGPLGIGKRIVFVVTQAAQWDRLRRIEEAGGAKAFLFGQNHWLEAFDRAASARVVAVSAVNNVVWKAQGGESVEPREENRDEGRLQGISWKGRRDGRDHFAPREFPRIKGENDSSGLVEFLLAAGAPLSPELDLLDRALCDLRERQYECAEARSSNSRAADRLKAAERLAEAWETYSGLAEAYLSNPARKISDRVRNLTRLHLDEEEGGLLHLVVAGRETDAALREAAASGLDLGDAERCDEFRRSLAARINRAMEEEAANRERPLAFRKVRIDDVPSGPWLRGQAMEYRSAASSAAERGGDVKTDRRRFSAKRVLLAIGGLLLAIAVALLIAFVVSRSKLIASVVSRSNPFFWDVFWDVFWDDFWHDFWLWFLDLLN